MKKALLCLACLFGVSAMAQNPLESISRQEGKAAQIRQSAPALLAADNSNFIYQRCEWTVDPAVRFISGNITTYFIPDLLLSQVEFDLSDSLTVDSVLYHGTPIVFSHLPGDILQTNLPSAISTLDSVTVFYHGPPPSGQGFGSFTVSTHGPNNTPVAWTLSEPYGAKDWWPCKQNLSDKIDSVDIIVHTPSAYRVASNGLLVTETVNGNQRSCAWHHRHPVAAYLVCFSVTDYAVYSDRVPFAGDTVEILNYVYPEDSAMAASSTANVIAQMQLYDTLFGAYPFTDEKYGHAQCGFGGGMEHQTMTFVGGFSYELLSHELAHHWFGDKVTCASWHDIWLNEGFASYLSGICYEHFWPGLYWPIFKQGRIGYITSQPDGAVYCADTVNVPRIFDDRLSYAKGAMILHTLRWVIGDSAWYAGVNNYLDDPALAYGFATTNDLKTHWENACGQNLTWYFNDWFYGEGYPSYTISWSQDQNNLVTFTVNQSQSHASVAFFELPLPIRFKNSSQDTTIRVDHTFSGESFSVQLSFAADSLLFDPDYWIISANNQVNEVQELSIDQSLTVYPNPAGGDLYIDAGNALSGDAEYFVYDAQGKQILQGYFVLSAVPQKLFVGGLAPGVYCLRIKHDDENRVTTFVK